VIPLIERDLVFATAKGFAILTVWTGFSSSSPCSEPIKNSPAGTVTISGSANGGSGLTASMMLE
jgi:hypothetical protein